MLLDLWTFSSVLNDVVDLTTHLRDNGALSFGSLLCCLIFFCISYIAWRSTDIPQDVPSAPAPPFVITIQNSSNVGGLRRQNLSDIRVVSPLTYSEFLGRYPFARTGRSIIRAHAVPRSQSVGSTPAQGNQDNAPADRHTASRGQQQSSRSFVLGFLRHPLALTRGLAPTRYVLNFFPPNVFVTSRILNWHREQRRRRQNIQQDHSYRERPERPQSPTPDSPENQISQPEAVTLTGQSSTIGRTSSVTDQSATNPSELIRTQEVSDNQTHTSTTPRMGSASENNQIPDLTEESDTENIANIIDGNIDDTKTPDSPDTITMASSQPDSSSPTTPSPDSSPEVKFTLKFLNDTQIEVNTHSGEKIGDFKRRHFVRELSENKIVRLIFNGRVLDQDNRTLQESGIFDHCVVHCLVVTPQQPAGGHGQPGGGANSTGFAGRNNNRAGQRGPEPGMFFMSFVGIILMFMWFVCINFGNHLFTQSAVVSLSILTLMFVAGIFTFYAPFQQQNNNNVNVN